MRKNIGGKGLDVSRNTSGIVDLKENIDLSRKEVEGGSWLGTLLSKDSEVRMFMKYVWEVSGTITRYIFHDLVGEADKFAVTA